METPQAHSDVPRRVVLALGWVSVAVGTAATAVGLWALLAGRLGVEARIEVPTPDPQLTAALLRAPPRGPVCRLRLTLEGGAGSAIDLPGVCDGPGGVEVRWWVAGVRRHLVLSRDGVSLAVDVDRRVARRLLRAEGPPPGCASVEGPSAWWIDVAGPAQDGAGVVFADGCAWVPQADGGAAVEPHTGAVPPGVLLGDIDGVAWTAAE